MSITCSIQSTSSTRGPTSSFGENRPTTSVGQRPSVLCNSRPGLDRGCRRHDCRHRAWLCPGEQLQRKVQRQTAQRSDSLLAPRDANPHRAKAPTLRHCPRRSALGDRPPVPESVIPMDQRPVMHQHSNWTPSGADHASCSVLEAPAFVASFNDVAEMRELIEKRCLQSCVGVLSGAPCR